MRTTRRVAGVLLGVVAWCWLMLPSAAAAQPALAPPTAATAEPRANDLGAASLVPEGSPGEALRATAPDDSTYWQPPLRLDRRAVRRPHRRSWALMAAGLAVFVASYAIPAGLGISLVADSSCHHCGQYAEFLIPVAGPLFFVKGHNDGDTGLVNAVLIADSVVQLAGLALSVIGIMRFVRSGEDAQAAPEPALTFNALPLPGGAYAGLSLWI